MTMRRMKGTELFRGKEITQRATDLAMLGRERTMAPSFVKETAQAQVFRPRDARPMMTQMELSRIVHSLEDKCNIKVKRMEDRLMEESKFRPLYEEAHKKAEELAHRNEVLHHNLMKARRLYEEERKKKDPEILPKPNDWIDSKLTTTIQHHLTQMMAEADEDDVAEIRNMQGKIEGQQMQINSLKQRLKAAQDKIKELQEMEAKRFKTIQDRGKRLKEAQKQAAIGAVRSWIDREKKKSPKPQDQEKSWGKILWDRLKGRMADVIKIGLKWQREEARLHKMTQEAFADQNEEGPKGYDTPPVAESPRVSYQRPLSAGARPNPRSPPLFPNNQNTSSSPGQPRQLHSFPRPKGKAGGDAKNTLEGKRAENRAQASSWHSRPQSPTPEQQTALVSKILNRAQHTQESLRNRPSLNIKGNPRATIRSKVLRKRLSPLSLGAPGKSSKRSPTAAATQTLRPLEQRKWRKSSPMSKTLSNTTLERRAMRASAESNIPTRQRAVQVIGSNARKMQKALKQINAYQTPKNAARLNRGQLSMALAEADEVIISLGGKVLSLQKDLELARHAIVGAKSEARRYKEHAVFSEEKVVKMANENLHLLEVGRFLEHKVLSLQKTAHQTTQDYEVGGEEFGRLQLHYERSQQLHADLKELVSLIQTCHFAGSDLRDGPKDLNTPAYIRRNERRFTLLIRKSFSALEKFLGSVREDLQWLSMARAPFLVKDGPVSARAVTGGPKRISEKEELPPVPASPAEIELSVEQDKGTRTQRCKTQNNNKNKKNKKNKRQGSILLHVHVIIDRLLRPSQKKLGECKKTLLCPFSLVCFPCPPTPILDRTKSRKSSESPLSVSAPRSRRKGRRGSSRGS
mmetsp:Transcript_20329/g.41017  ORF Transcript_20329/g.41017 Transcript_20329/m.41017 type:complete len:859 (+) Transcript_20329:200-2776(+)